MTKAQETELYLLRRHFGIGAREAYNVLPAWEVELLIGKLAEEAKEAQRG